MKTTRVVMERAISDGAFFVAEKEIDQHGNVINVFLTIDGQTVAKRANGKWKAPGQGVDILRMRRRCY